MGRTERGARGPLADAPSIELLAPRADLFDLDHRPHSFGVTPTDPHPGFARSRGDVDHGDAETGFAVADVDADDEPASRWVTISAGIGLVALVAVGVLAAAPWSEDGRSDASPASTNPAADTLVVPSVPMPTMPKTPPTSPVAVAPQPGGPDTVTAGDGSESGTGPAAGTPTAVDDEALAASGYLLDPILLPVTWRTEGGLGPTVVTAERGTGDGEGWLELWATDGASRTTGSWFAVQHRRAEVPPAVQDAARIALGDRIGFLTTTFDGVSELTFPSWGATATLTWFGEDQALMFDMAEGLMFNRTGRPRFPDLGFQSEHTRVYARASLGEGLERDLSTSGLISSVRYRRDQQSADVARPDSGFGDTLVVNTRHADPALDEVLSRFVIGSAMSLDREGPMFIPPGASSIVSGRLVFAESAAPQDLQILQWTSGAHTVQLVSSLPISQLFEELPVGLVGPGTSAAWDRVRAGSIVPLARDHQYVGEGTLDDGSTWDMDIAPEVGWVSTFVTAPDGRTGFGVQLDLGVRECATAARPDATVIICLRPASAGPTTLRIEAGWGSREIDLAPIGSGGWIGVVHRFTETGGFTASLIGSNGATTPGISIGAAGQT